MLKEKTQMNKHTAEWAVERNYFDVAISRYYYSMLQKMLYLANRKNYVCPSGKDSHVELYNYLISNFKLAPEQLRALSNFRKLKDIRKKADYEELLHTKTVFEKTFLYHYNPIDNVLNKVIEREEKNGCK